MEKIGKIPLVVSSVSVEKQFLRLVGSQRGLNLRNIRDLDVRILQLLRVDVAAIFQY